jgi:hypothetical protein
MLPKSFCFLLAGLLVVIPLWILMSYGCDRPRGTRAPSAVRRTALRNAAELHHETAETVGKRRQRPPLLVFDHETGQPTFDDFGARLRLATSSSARFGAASPIYLCERFTTLCLV